MNRLPDLMVPAGPIPKSVDDLMRERGILLEILIDVSMGKPRPDDQVRKEITKAANRLIGITCAMRIATGLEEAEFAKQSVEQYPNIEEP